MHPWCWVPKGHPLQPPPPPPPRYSKPLLESGTRGTQSNSEVILPFRTSTYNDGEDVPEVGIAMCTLRSFPYLPLHCIEFAKQALYTENFEFGPQQYEKFRCDKAGFFASLDDMSKVRCWVREWEGTPGGAGTGPLGVIHGRQPADDCNPPPPSLCKQRPCLNNTRRRFCQFLVTYCYLDKGRGPPRRKSSGHTSSSVSRCTQTKTRTTGRRPRDFSNK